jgi:hypothetical protein
MPHFPSEDTRQPLLLLLWRSKAHDWWSANDGRASERRENTNPDAAQFIIQNNEVKYIPFCL